VTFHECAHAFVLGQILEFFGPVADPQLPPPTTGTVIDNMRKVLENPWFHGDIDEKVAQEVNFLFSQCLSLDPSLTLVVLPFLFVEVER